MGMRFIGLDVHQKYAEGCEIDPDKQKRRFRIANTRESWEEFAQTLDSETRVVIEATSNAFWIYDILSDYPAQVVIANPHCNGGGRKKIYRAGRCAKGGG
jgi:hypothetical protein